MDELVSRLVLRCNVDIQTSKTDNVDIQTSKTDNVDIQTSKTDNVDIQTVSKTDNVDSFNPILTTPRRG
jgi:hypothetical protein